MSNPSWVLYPPRVVAERRPVVPHESPYEAVKPSVEQLGSQASVALGAQTHVRDLVRREPPTILGGLVPSADNHPGARMHTAMFTILQFTAVYT